MRPLYLVSLKLALGSTGKWGLFEDSLDLEWVGNRIVSQSKHTRSILIPRSVGVNVEAEAEYISRRRNEVSSLVNKQERGVACLRARAHPALAYRNSISTTSFMC